MGLKQSFTPRPVLQCKEVRKHQSLLFLLTRIHPLLSSPTAMPFVGAIVTSWRDFRKHFQSGYLSRNHLPSICSPCCTKGKKRVIWQSFNSHHVSNPRKPWQSNLTNTQDTVFLTLSLTHLSLYLLPTVPLPEAYSHIFLQLHLAST